MNNIDINSRKACLKAINYSYALEVLGKGEREQLTSLVPAGILYHWWDAPVPTMDLAEARAAMAEAVRLKEKGITEPSNWATLKDSTTDADWEAVTILELEYNYNEGNDYRKDVGALTKSDFAKVGVKLNVHGLQWEAYLDALHSGDNDMYNLGWGPDFNDPSNYVDSLAGSTSTSNNAHVNDSVLDNLLAEGLLITDPEEREAKYIEIQQRINELYVFGYLSTPNGRSVYNKGCKNTARNAMGKLYWYLWDFDPTYNAANRVSIGGGIPSFDIVALFGVCAITLSAIVYKKRH
jgi:ABC-type transport system substrate-binding protein